MPGHPPPRTWPSCCQFGSAAAALLTEQSSATPNGPLQHLECLLVLPMPNWWYQWLPLRSSSLDENGCETLQCNCDHRNACRTARHTSMWKPASILQFNRARGPSISAALGMYQKRCAIVKIADALGKRLERSCSHLLRVYSGSVCFMV